VCGTALCLSRSGRYLWDPAHSTAQLEDLVTKDPSQFELFARLPLMLSSAAFSLVAVLYAKPLITPVALVCLVAYKCALALQNSVCICRRNWLVPFAVFAF
jgi:hypothetical protein